MVSNTTSHQRSSIKYRTQHRAGLIHPPIYPSIHPSIHPSIYPCMHACIHPSIHPFTHPSYTLSFTYPAVPDPPWSSISAPFNVPHPKWSRARALTLSVMSFVTVLPPCEKEPITLSAPKMAPVALFRKSLNLFELEAGGGGKSVLVKRVLYVYSSTVLVEMKKQNKRHLARM